MTSDDVNIFIHGYIYMYIYVIFLFWDSWKIHYDGETGIGGMYSVKVVMVAYTTILPGGLYSSAIQPDS